VGPIVTLLLAAHVQLLTMGESGELYARFGHAALRVTDDAGDRVYNFGTTDFLQPDLVQRFLRGHVKFWVQPASFRATLAAYRREDRSIWVQELNLTPAQHEALAAKLAWQALPQNRMYDYDHFTDNCTTRLRDLLDEAMGGRLRHELDAPHGSTVRELATTGFGDLVSVQMVADLILGNWADRPLAWWDAAFLPRVLRQALLQARTEAGLPVAGPPLPLYLRRGPEIVSGAPHHAGRRLMFAFGFALLAFGTIGLRVARVASAMRWTWAIVGGLLGAALLALAAYSTLPLLRQNANLIVLSPLDGLLLGRPGLRLVYGAVRLGSIAVVLLVWHPPLSVATLAACGLLGALLRDVRDRVRPRAAV
jgi:hypothetical protein